MIFKEILSSKKYWISVSFIGLGFIIVFSIIEIILSITGHFMQYGELTMDSFVNEKINEGKWFRYLISRVVGGLLYGMIVAYYFELRKRKSKR
ncbi:hypothetical protein U6A24_00675 [Aquimarina gracilis]|uniref:Uncharacterized protein n=1 Tax=Aquimarina gracilis TaxID=874422 RepID=A0ABU5ZP98_9FLAO|nr:hypothetical protein [Aquimarina gracilis]MEB3343949.1 hypothetical protein [Aquimarina gracilis]